MRKLVLVTGAAGLLGKQHVMSLLAGGHEVVASDINHEVLESSFKTMKCDHLSLSVLDVTDEQQIENLNREYD